jgi:general L-amino acid transport system permease protein
MSEITSGFVRDATALARPAPVTVTGPAAWLRTRLFNSPGNILLTFVCAALAWLVLEPTVRFLFVDAVWQGRDRGACLAEVAGHPVGACWPFVSAKLGQFVYGFYPEAQRWRVDLVFLLGALLLVPLLIPRLPAKALNATLFFAAFPVVAFFLLYGGGLQSFAVSWSASAAATLAGSLSDAGVRLGGAGEGGALFAGAGMLLRWLGAAVGWLASPLIWLGAAVRQSAAPLWTDLALSAVLLALVALGLGGVRAAVKTVAAFAAIALVVLVLGLDRGGLPIVSTRQWGGLLVTLVVSVTGIVASMPVGMALALGRRSDIPLIRILSVAFIEFWRGVPLITVLFFATYMLPLFLPGNFTLDGLVRVLVGIALFAGAYNAEVIRGGLQAIPRGQAEAAAALGLSYWKTMRLVVMPQALRHVIPGLVNSFIALFKDTTLVLIVSIFDLLGQLRAAFADPNWATPTTLFTGFAFTGAIYFVFCFGMSRYSLFVERRLNAHRRR